MSMSITDTMHADAAIEAMAARLRDEYGAEAVILYGSRADGRARPDSDVDLMIIKSEASGGSIARSREVDAILSDLKNGLYLDIHIYTPEQMERTLAGGDHFVQDIILTGKVLHEGEDFEGYVELARYSYNMDPRESEYPKEWLKIADSDYERVLRLLDVIDPQGAGFFLHQAVENFFKAYLIRQGWRARREHNLDKLLNHALHYDATLEQYRTGCELLTICYLAQLYPRYLWKETYPTPPIISDENVRAALAEIAPLIERLREGSARANDNEQDIEGGS